MNCDPFWRNDGGWKSEGRFALVTESGGGDIGYKYRLTVSNRTFLSLISQSFLQLSLFQKR